MGKRILVVGAANMDFTIELRTLPAAGESVTEERAYRYTAGGAGALAAMAITRLGGEALFAARLGGDVHGDRLLHLYAEAGMDTRFISVDRREPSGLRVIMREENGNSRTVYYPGANAGLLLSDVERAILDGSPDAVYLQTELSPEIFSGVYRLAERYEIPLCVDVGGSKASFAPVREAEILCVGNKEAYELTGIFPVGSDSCLKAAVELEKRVRARHYLLRLGDRGMFAYDGRYCHMVPGCGVRIPEGTPLCDSLTAAVLLEYLQNGGDIMAACRFGLSLNALLFKNSADPAYFPGAEEIRAFADRH